MPARNKAGPPKGSTGPQDGRGGGKGTHASSKRGTGKRTGGRKGSC